MVTEPFQEDFVADVFARDAADVSRPAFLECWLLIAEGNTKTTTIAALVLYHIRHRPKGYVPVAASSRDQAEQLYRQAEGLIKATEERHPTWKGFFKYLEGYRRIRCDGMGSRIQIYAADDATGDGVIPTLCITEELHRHKNLKLYRTWRGKVKKRRGQIVAISTAGEPGSEFEQTRARMRESLPDVTRRTCFTRAAGRKAVLHDWAIPEKADPYDLEVVKNASPFSGITIASLREDLESPSFLLTHWKRFKCNLPTRSENAAITEAEWAAHKTKERIPRGQPVAVGLDVAWKWDTCAMVPLWAKSATSRLLAPAVILEPPRDGSSLHPDIAKKALREIHERNPIHTLVMDITRAEDLAAWATDELGCEVLEHSQSNAQAALDYERFMKALRTGGLEHAGDGGLTSHAMNAVARMLPDGKTRFERPASMRQAEGQERRVIDALTAAAMVNSEVAAPTKKPSVYEKRGLRTVG